MARPTTYADRQEENDQLARAGARSLERIGSELANIDHRNLAVQREARMAESQALNDEVQRWNFEKEKALDRNAAQMKIETDKQAIAANEELFKINTGEEDAGAKLADWGAKYFRVLDDKTGDPRLIRQFQINQTRVENRNLLRLKADELRTVREEKAAEAKALTEERKANAEAARAEIATRKLVESGATIDEKGNLRTTYTTPGERKNTPEDKIMAQQKAMTSGALSFGKLDKNGHIVPNSGDEKATHVAAFYPNPTTGKMDRTPPMTIAEFQAFEKAAKENAVVAPKSAPAADTGAAKAPAATAAPTAPASEGKKLYTRDQNMIQYATGKDFFPSVQQALDDGLISPEQGRETLVKAGFKPKTK